MPNIGKILPEPSETVKATAKSFFGEAKTIRFVDFRGDPVLNRKPDYYLYVFNIAPRKFTVHRPPNFPTIVFPGCPSNEKFALVARFPNVIHQQVENIDTGAVSLVSEYAERFVTDLLNPSNLSNDCWAAVPDSLLDNHGSDDLTRRGLFWTTNEVPTDEELRKARAKLEAHYKRLLQEGDQLYNDPKTRPEIGPEHHAAADYYGYRAQWHIVAEIPATCPICGEAIKAGVAFHVNSIGTRCVLDWHRAVAAGVVKREDVPVEARWWKDDKEPLAGV